MHPYCKTFFTNQMHCKVVEVQSGSYEVETKVTIEQKLSE